MKACPLFAAAISLAQLYTEMGAHGYDMDFCLEQFDPFPRHFQLAFDGASQGYFATIQLRMVYIEARGRMRCGF